MKNIYYYKTSEGELKTLKSDYEDLELVAEKIAEVEYNNNPFTEDQYVDMYQGCVQNFVGRFKIKVAFEPVFYAVKVSHD